MEDIMWTADNWKDYEVIDTCGGEKLERWGQYILVRPDPQVIWNTPKTDKRWKKMNGHYRRSNKGGGEWEFFDLPEQWTIQYHHLGLSFNLKPSASNTPVCSRNRLPTGTGSLLSLRRPTAL